MTTQTANHIDLEEVDSLRQKLGLQKAELAQIIGVDQSTVYRWRQGEATPRGVYVSRIVQVQEIFELLRSIFADPDLARDWLRHSTPQSLGVKDTPIAVMLNGRVDRVLNALEFIARGA